MSRNWIIMACVVLLGSCTARQNTETDSKGFVSIEGTNLVTPDGKQFFIMGTNLGNWLNPEGYMFGFSKTNSAWMIDQMLRQLVGPEETDKFWSEFKDNYITRQDIDFIASTGANTIRLPFHYKLFTDEDYMGQHGRQDGYARVDSVVTWCRDNGLYLILDMHDAPGGQTGDNIDDSYGYPWLFESEQCQKQMCDIWHDIADHYKDEPIILGYELINEPIAHYFDNKEEINSQLEPLQKKVVKAIREVDNNHIILLGGAQWNSNFDVFTDWNYDPKIMYTCHRYGGPATKEAISNFIDFRDRTGLPMYMGEIGHNTMEWQEAFSQVMRDNNIGYTYWPYKKVDESCFMGIDRPENWNDVVVAFSEADRSTYAQLRELKPDRKAASKALKDFVKNSRFENCTPQIDYIKTLGMKSAN